MNNSALVLKSTSLKTKRLQLALVSGTIIAAGVILFFFEPTSSKLYPSCPFLSLTGLFCPGCGTLRALHQLLHGHLGTALDFNPLAIISLPFLAYSYLSFALEVIRGKPLARIFIKAKWIWFFLEAIIAFWIVRNIPFEPFSLLAP